MNSSSNPPKAKGKAKPREDEAKRQKSSTTRSSNSFLDQIMEKMGKVPVPSTKLTKKEPPKKADTKHKPLVSANPLKVSIFFHCANISKQTLKIFND